jgi:hypothetical protein
MQARARELGARLIDEERKLDELFASKTASRESVCDGITLDCFDSKRNPGSAPPSAISKKQKS